MIKALVFDLDNTLYCFDAAHEAGLQALTEETCRLLDVAPEAVSSLHREAMQIQQDRAGEDNAAIHNRLIRFQIMLEQMGRPISFAPRMAEAYWSAFLACTRPDPGAEEVLAFAKAAGLTVGVGTNMTADYQFAKLQRLGLLEAVDFLVTSEEAGADKPDARVFRLCAEKAGCPAEACVFVGDNFVHDVLGAKAAGLHPVWLCPDPDREPPVPGIDRLRALRELPALLRGRFGLEASGG